MTQINISQKKLKQNRDRNTGPPRIVCLLSTAERDLPSNLEFPPYLCLSLPSFLSCNHYKEIWCVVYEFSVLFQNSQVLQFFFFFFCPIAALSLLLLESLKAAITLRTAMVISTHEVPKVTKLTSTVSLVKQQKNKYHFLYEAPFTMV